MKRLLDRYEDCLQIVQNGEANAVLVVPKKMNPDIKCAIELLAEYIQKSTGALLPTVAEQNLKESQACYDRMVYIYVGFVGENSEQNIGELLYGMNDDGFLIRYHKNSITIIGPTIWGTRFGVYNFLERYLGIRWLMPGPEGEDVPEMQNLTIPAVNIKEEPVFMMRVFSPLFDPEKETGPIQHEWADRNRLHWRIDFHHNLYSLFPPAEYGKIHPEFYPMRNGVRYIPGQEEKASWQPCFAVPETIEEAAKKIIRYFDENPEATSFSLGVNDSRGYCDGTHQEYYHHEDSVNSVGLTDMSNHYYKWVNEVVKEVRKKHPDKWFGVLAYDSVADPPSFKIDPHIVPFITKDRMAWIDPAVEAVGKEQVSKWKEAAEHIGWYDYIYGLSYSLPRIYSHKMAENYKYAKLNGVSAHYAELYPNWGEGPKPWLSAKLQWNPDLDVDVLLNEWYASAVGPEAAPYLKKYYDHWEVFWTERIKGSTWFESRKNTTYLAFNNADYLKLVTANEIEKCRELLELAVSKTKTERQKARANIILEMFEYYEAAALSYPRELGPINDAKTALSYLEDRVLKSQINLEEKHEKIISKILKNKLFKFPRDPRDFGLKWSWVNPDLFWRLVDYMTAFETEGGSVSAYVRELVNKEDNAEIRQFAGMLLGVKAGIDCINMNSSFEEEILDREEAIEGIWSPWLVKQNSINQSKGVSRAGSTSLRISDVDYGGLFQIMPVKPGLAACRAYCYASGKNKNGATIEIYFNLMDKDKKFLSTITSKVWQLSNMKETWIPIDTLVAIPGEAAGSEVKYIQLIFAVNGLINGSELYLDDAKVYQI